MNELNDDEIKTNTDNFSYVSFFLLDENENFKNVTEEEFYRYREDIYD